MPSHGFACGRRGGAIPTTFLAPEEARGATAVANTVAFFAMMDTFVHWQGGCCVNSGGGNVLVLTACKSRQWMARREREGVTLSTYFGTYFIYLPLG